MFSLENSATNNRRSSTVQIIDLYLQALLQQSRTLKHAQAMINQGLLSVLWQVAHIFSTESKLETLCAQIVANLSQFEVLHTQIFQSGL